MSQLGGIEHFQLKRNWQYAMEVGIIKENELLGDNILSEASSNRQENKEQTKTCFVIMPISELTEYGDGHFARVYDYLIKPACKKAGFEAKRANETKESNLIMLDILQQIYNADMLICDLSAKNPNVMYELGIRQAFELPTLLIKDRITSRVFDISSLRDIEYDHSLRIDSIEKSIIEISDALLLTHEAYKKGDKNHINSIVSLLGLSPAKVNQTEISQETIFILESLNRLHSQVSWIERNVVNKSDNSIFNSKKEITVAKFRPGELVRTSDGRSGRILDYAGNDVVVDIDSKAVILPPSELVRVIRRPIKKPIQE